MAGGLDFFILCMLAYTDTGFWNTKRGHNANYRRKSDIPEIESWLPLPFVLLRWNIFWATLFSSQCDFVPVIICNACISLLLFYNINNAE